MAIEFDCQTCGEHYRVKDAYAGASYACRACGAPMVVPQGHVAPILREDGVRIDPRGRREPGEASWAAPHGASDAQARDFDLEGFARFRHPVSEGGSHPAQAGGSRLGWWKETRGPAAEPPARTRVRWSDRLLCGLVILLMLGGPVSATVATLMHQHGNWDQIETAGNALPFTLVTLVLAMLISAGLRSNLPAAGWKLGSRRWATLTVVLSFAFSLGSLVAVLAQSLG